MHHASLDQFLTDAKEVLAKGPIAIVFAEDPVEVDTTLRHHLSVGFVQVLLLAPAAIALPEPLAAKITRIDLEVHAEGAFLTAITKAATNPRLSRKTAILMGRRPLERSKNGGHLGTQILSLHL